MADQFQIEAVVNISSQDKVYVLARELKVETNWKLSENARLGEVEIEKWLDIPRSLDENGSQRMDLFAFCLKNTYDKDKLKIGDIVELIT